MGRRCKRGSRKNPDGIDLLVLDVVMPRIDGFSVLRWMKEKSYTGRFPVLVISGVYKSGEVVNRLKALGACGVMTKRFTPEQIIHHIHLVLYPRNKDKRLLQRAPAAVPVTFTIGDSSHTGNLMNIGESGLFLKTKSYLLAGSVLEITFSLPGSRRTFNLKGIVMWATTLGTPDDLFEGAGIAFTSISEKEREALQRFSSRRLTSNTHFCRDTRTRANGDTRLRRRSPHFFPPLPLLRKVLPLNKQGCTIIGSLRPFGKLQPPPP